MRSMPSGGALGRAARVRLHAPRDRIEGSAPAPRSGPGRGQFLSAVGDGPGPIFGLGEGLLDIPIPISADEEAIICRAGPGFWSGQAMPPVPRFDRRSALRPAAASRGPAVLLKAQPGEGRARGAEPRGGPLAFAAGAVRPNVAPAGRPRRICPGEPGGSRPDGRHEPHRLSPRSSTLVGCGRKTAASASFTASPSHAMRTRTDAALERRQREIVAPHSARSRWRRRVQGEQARPCGIALGEPCPRTRPRSGRSTSARRWPEPLRPLSGSDDASDGPCLRPDAQPPAGHRALPSIRTGP